jgi:hypothetical protein
LDISKTFQTKGKTKKYSNGTKYIRLAIVKEFLKNVNKEAASAITIKQQFNRKLPEDLLTKEDIEILLNSY